MYQLYLKRVTLKTVITDKLAALIIKQLTILLKLKIYIE